MLVLRSLALKPLTKPSLAFGALVQPYTTFGPAKSALDKEQRRLPQLNPAPPTHRAAREGSVLVMGFGGAQPVRTNAKPSYQVSAKDDFKLGGGSAKMNPEAPGFNSTGVINRPTSPNGGSPNAPLKKKRAGGGFRSISEATRLEHSAKIYSRVINVGRVARMTSTGRKFQVRALIIMGNCDGAGGFGVGKGKTNAEALEDAYRQAEKDLVHVDRSPWGSLYHDVQGRYNDSKCIIRAISHNKLYYTAGHLTRAIMICFGLSRFSCILIGRRNPYTVVNAVFDALGKHQTPNQVAWRRNRLLLDKANPNFWKDQH